MRDIPPELIIESVDAGVGAFIDLFELDLRPYGGNLERFHSGTNGFYNNVIWRGNAYPAYPIAVEGFESRNEGTYARPAMAVANVTGMIFGMNHDFEDLLGVVITRRQVPVKYLDAVNFPNGNPDADPTMEAVSRYVVEEMTEETSEQVPVLSGADRAMQVMTGLPWWLACDGELRKFRPVAHLLGRRFEHGVTDCYTLFRDAYHLCGIDLPDFARSDGWWLRGENLYLKNLAANGFHQVSASEAVPGDVIIRQPFPGADPCHAMILLDDNMVLHHDHAGYPDRCRQRWYRLCRLHLPRIRRLSSGMRVKRP